MLCSCSKTPENVSHGAQQGQNKQQISKIEVILPEHDIGTFSGNVSGRFYPEKTYDFIPNEEYGTLIPYIGSYKQFFESDWGMTQTFYSYGLCTSDGKIVTDASGKINYVMSGVTSDGFEYYQLTIADEDYDIIFAGPEKQLFIPKTGQWCIEIRGGWLSFADNGLIGISYSESESPARTEIYGYDGKLITTIDSFDSVGSYSHGLMPAWDWKSNAHQYYINLEGEKVLGPYKNITAFNSKGTAAVTDLNSESYLIDTQGNRLTHGNYSNLYHIYDNSGRLHPDVLYCGEVRTKYAQRDVIDAYGNIVGTAHGGSYADWIFADGEIIYSYRNNDDTYTFKRLSDGEPVVCSENGLSPNNYAVSDKYLVYNDGTDAIIMDIHGNTVYKTDNFGSFCDVSQNGRFLAYSINQSDLTQSQVVIYDTAAKKEIMREDGYYVDISDYFDGFLTITLQSPSSDGFSDTTRYMLYDIQSGKFLLDGNVRGISFFEAYGEKYINICTKNSCTLYGKNMEIITRTYFD